MQVIFSVCITNYNMARTIHASLESLLSQLDERFEVVVCDNFSTDGSADLLREYEQQGKLRLVQARTNRGEGRQLAYRNANGRYIISGLDMDDTFKPILKDILERYFAYHSGFMWSVGKLSHLHIIPREIVNEVGGWLPIPFYEDVMFCRAVESTGKLHYEDSAQMDIFLRRGSHKENMGIMRRARQIYAMKRLEHRYNIENKTKGHLHIRLAVFLIGICATVRESVLR